MSVTRPSIVDWVHSKTQILLATLRTQNQLRWEESYVYSEVEHLSASVRCARSKRQYPTALQNPKSFRWMQDCAWMVYLLSSYGTWWMKYCDQQTEPNHQPIPQHLETDTRQVTVCETHPNSNKRETDMLINGHMWIMSPLTHNWVSVVHFWR